MKKFLTATDEKSQLVKKNTRILCSISSGQDSIVSFFLLLHLKNLNLEILYCQHFWQTKNFISSVLIFKLSFLFEISYNTSLPQKLVLNENHSRVWRKKNFFRVSTLEKRVILVTGQTLTDTVEKFFNTLVRGTTSRSFSESKFLNFKINSYFFFSKVILKPSFNQKECFLNRFFILFWKSKVIIRKNLVIIKKWTTTKILVDFLTTSTLSFETRGVLPSSIELLKKKKSKFQENYKPINLKTKNKLTKLKKDLNFLPFCEKKKLKTKKLRNDNNKKFYSLNYKKNLLGSQIKKKSFNFFIKKQCLSCSFCTYSKALETKLISKKLLREQTRFTVSKILKLYDFPIITDATNFSPKFSRNKIRSKFFPLIRYLFNTKFEFLIKNFLQTLESEQKFLNHQIQEILLILKIQNATKKLGSSRKKVLNKKITKLRTNSILEKFGCSLERSLIQNIFSQYSDIELTYFQTWSLQTLINK